MLRFISRNALNRRRRAAFGIAATSGLGVCIYQYNSHYYNCYIPQDANEKRGSSIRVVGKQQELQDTTILATSTTNNPSPSASFPFLIKKNSTDSLLDSCREKSAQFKALMEASSRAANLVLTVCLVISDYKLDELEQNYEEIIQNVAHRFGFLGEEGKRIGNVNHNDKHDVNKNKKYIRSLEKAIRHRSKELQNAQKGYSTSGDDENKPKDEATIEQQRLAVLEAARQLSQAEESLRVAQEAAAQADDDEKKRNHLRQEAEKHMVDEQDMDNTIHACAARRIRDLCRSNGGTYIKVGQHLANLDHLLPPAYIQTLQSLFGEAPTTLYNDVREVVKEELGGYPEEIFDAFEKDPIASASLAQVHIAEKDGKKLAVKVQHRGLRETSKGDLLALEGVVRLVDRLFDDFKWGWIVDEIAPNLPKELNFQHEGRNAELAALHIRKAGLENDCIVPKVHWGLTTPRVLVMDFEHGYSSTNIREIEAAGVCKKDLAILISSVFQSQIFQSGHVHCDPHPANVFWRQKENGKPQLVLFDHGLYKQIDDDFRLKYARLWKSLLIADIGGIKESCSSLGVEEMYPLLAAMLTSRPFDEIMERSKSRSFTTKDAASMSMDANADAAMIRGYAQQYLKEIIQMLDKVPRQMLLLFKMNDCLRHIDHALGSPANTMVVAGKYAAQALYDDDHDKARARGGIVGRLHRWVSHLFIMTRIRAFELFVHNRHASVV